MRKLFFIPVLFAFGLFILSILIGGFSLMLYTDIICFGINILIPLFLLMSSFSFAEMGIYFKVSMKNTTADEKDLKKALVFFKTIEKYQISVGVVGTMYGLVGMLANMDDPSLIGRGLAASLITILYAAFIICFFTTPFKSAIEKKLV